MNNRRPPINEDALNRFWNELVRPTSDLETTGIVLDMTTADIVRQIQTLGAAPSPASSRERVRHAVHANLRSLRASNETGPVTHIDGNRVDPTVGSSGQSSGARVAPPPTPHTTARRRTWVFAQFATAALLIVMLLLISYLFFATNPPAGEPLTQVPASPVATPTASPAGSLDVPMYRSDPARTGAMGGPGPAGEPVQHWRIQGHGKVEGAPAIVAGVLYVGIEDGSLYALNAATGSARWRFTATDEIDVGQGIGVGGPAVAGDLVFAASDLGSLFAVEVTSGQERWSYGFGSAIGSPVVVNGTVYAVSNNGYLEVLDGGTGARYWGRKVSTANVLNGPSVANGIVYLGADDGTLYALYATGLKDRWQFATGFPLVQIPAIADGVVYVGARSDATHKGVLIAVDAESGEELWRFQTADEAYLTDPAIGAGVVCVGSYDGTVYCLDQATGTLKWSYATDQGEPIVAAPAIAGEILYVAGQDRTIYALDVATGAELWRFGVDGGVSYGPTVSGGIVYVGTDAGSVYAIGEPIAGATTVSTAFAPPTSTSVVTSSAVGSPNAGIGTATLLWQTTGGPEPLAGASGISLAPDGKIWVNDVDNHRFQIFDQTGAFLETWQPDSAAGKLWVAFDQQGNIYVGSGGSLNISKYDRDRKLLSSWGYFGNNEGLFNELSGLAVDTQGNIYVSDRKRDVIQKFDADGGYLLTFGGRGSGDGQLIEPGVVRTDVEGNVYVVDAGNNRIEKFDSNGMFLDSFGAEGNGPGQFDDPAGIALDASGNLFVADSGNHRIEVLNPQGLFLGAWGSLGEGPGQFTGPDGIAVDETGIVYTADTATSRVAAFHLEEVIGST
jgi:outer membrane protein assembly factor BamB